MYFNRLVEKEIELKLKTSGAVVVAGPPDFVIASPKNPHQRV